MRPLYTVALLLALPLILLRLLWRARKQPEYLHHIGERFGRYAVRCDQPVIWLHAVSVGETRATQNLVARLRENYPAHRILITHTTPTGRATGEQMYGDDVLRAYLPYDYPFAVNGFLRHFRPQLCILMETEIWFNLIHACRRNDIPLLLLNARMSDKSARGYARFARLTRSALGALASVGAQTEDDAHRLAGLGAHDITVTGNLKFDIEPPPAMLERGRQLREQFGMARKVFLAASTREGEEALLLDALKDVHIPGLLLVIVPRHPQRFDNVADLFAQRNITFRRRSDNRPVPADTQVVLGDSMGEMFAYYAAADIAFIGGSLLPYGAQNLIEACAAGTPVLVGPHTFNFAEATRLAVAAGAAIQVPDGGTLIAEARRLLSDPEALAEMRKQGIVFVERNRGATNESLRIVTSLLTVP
ncbi:MAG: lipid IV(A) 3-deoxy-D-manno-octulosonic acid transferase [Nitrosomonadales bacterium]|nr:lipid IV(A) 3-deoxy-D-manno-octulosonic acid transferase [Nitrosomonadales bacterium]